MSALIDRVTVKTIGSTEIKQIAYLDFCDWIISEATSAGFYANGLPFLFCGGVTCECYRDGSTISFRIGRFEDSDFATLEKATLQHGHSLGGELHLCQVAIERMTKALEFALGVQEQLKGVHIQVPPFKKWLG